MVLDMLFTGVKCSVIIKILQVPTEGNRSCLHCNKNQCKITVMPNNVQTMRFGIEHADDMTGRLYVDLPDGMYEEVFRMPVFTNFKEILTDTNVKAMSVQKLRDSQRIVINEGSIGHRPKKVDVLQAVTAMITGLGIIAARKNIADPKLDVKMSSRFNVEGKLPTNYVIAMYDSRFLKDADIADFGSTAMANAASRLRFASSIDRMNDPYAVVDRREAFVGLHVNPQKVHEVTSVSRAYHVKDTFALTESSLEVFEEQYIGLVGAVAIARAHEYLPYYLR